MPMSDNQIQTVMDQIGGLWPEAKLDPAQLDVWKARLRAFDPELVRLSVNDAFSDTKRMTPYLSDVLTAIRKRGQTFKKQVRDERKDAQDEEVKREEEEDRFVLSQWTAQDLAEAKAEILRREPYLKSTLGAMPVTASWWLHLIRTRMVDKVVTVYPGGEPMQMNVEEWWDECDKRPMRVDVEVDGTTTVMRKNTLGIWEEDLPMPT